MDTHYSLTPASPDAPIPQEDIEALKAELNALLGAVPPDKQWTSAEVEAGLRDLRRHFNASLAPGLPLSDPNVDLSEADLLDRYIDGHQETVYVHGRFWRQPLPQSPWQPVPEHLIRAEVLMTLHNHQDRGVSPTRHRLESVLALLKVRLGAVVEPGGWDDTTGFIPFPNIAFELGGRLDEGLTYDLLPFIATTLPYTYEPIAECPAWEAFLQSAAPHAVEFLQEFAGYCVTHYTHFEQSFWVCGPPHSGKSTLLHGFQTLLGPFAARLPVPDLVRGRLDPHAFASKRLLIVDEAPLAPAAVSPLTDLIDGQPLTFTVSGHLPVEVRCHAKLIFAFQGHPPADSRFGSLYRRGALLVLQACPPSQRDPELKNRISREGQGLYNWAIRGWARLVRRGRFDPPATMLAEMNALRLASLSPQDFIDQHCLCDPNARTQSSVLNRAYLTWCAQQSLPPVSSNVLAKQWKNLGFEYSRSGGKSYWGGVQLLTLALAAPPIAHPPVEQEN